MDVDTEADKRYSADHGDPGAMSDTEREDHRSYTVTRLPASEHAELASAVLNSAGPKINCPVTTEASHRMNGDHGVTSGDWPADHTAIC